MRAASELAATLQYVKVPAFIVDRNGIVTWLNDAAKELFGDLVGRPVTSVVAPQYVALMQEQLERKLRGARSTDYEVEVMTADGRRRRAEISSVPIAHGDSCHAVFGIALVGPPVDQAAPSVSLTPRQYQVLRMLAEGAATDQIAAALHLSRETVRNHVRNILRALGAHSRLEAVAVAHRRGLLDED
jgi:PAS domain S-box-containing protein